MSSHAETLRTILQSVPVIPVVTVDDARISIDLAQMFVRSGLTVIEIAMRTPAALDAINAIAKAVPEAVVAAGTVLHTGQIEEAIDAGAKFLVTPGTPLRLAEELREASVPVLPGCASVTEAMALSELGFERLKFFPAAASGGTAWLKSVYGPLPQLSFCPTGGIGPESAPSYLALPNVACIGGTWVASPDLLRQRDFAAIGRLAVEAAALRARK